MATKGLPKNEKWYVGTLGGAPQIAFQLGEMTAAWAQMEHAFPAHLANLLGTDRGGAEAVLFAINTTVGKIEILKAVATRKAQKARAKNIVAALEGIQKLCKRRNVFVHHMMGYDDRGRVCRWDFREDTDTQARRIIVKEADLITLITDIRKAYNALTFAMYPEAGPPPASQGKQTVLPVSLKMGSGRSHDLKALLPPPKS